MIQDFEFADVLGPAKIIHVHEPWLGLRGTLVVDNVAHGGGKSVLRGDARMPAERKQQMIRAFAHALRHEHDYIFGPDMGTDETCMAWLHDEIGRAVGLPRAFGGIPLDELGATGWGLASAAQAAVPFCGFKLAGARVAVQGFGTVGKHAARFLLQHGATLVAVSDTHGAVLDAHGIDVEALIRLEDGGGTVLDYPRGDKRGADAACEI
jgi:glutamate dehydrogenase (NAD(P)+)